MVKGRDDDSAVWRSVTADVKPLRGRNRPKAATPPAPAPGVKPQTVSTAPAPVRKPPEPLKLGHASGVDKRTAERLRRGQMSIETRLDLHGHTRESAHRALSGFLAAAWESGRRTVLIVTGKGQGILKDAVPRWLNESPNRDRILLVAQAQPKDGGGGALYVLLRRRR
tara:strand:+ start:489 stop:992 length:504 start_codon:yes stop_codon:yes gene_type:complete